MKIAHVIDYFHTDYLYQEFYLAKSQAEAGHDVRVIASVHRHGSVGAAGDGEDGRRLLNEAGVDVIRLQAHQLGHDRSWMSGLRAALKAFGPDVVQCHGAFGPTTLRTALACHRADVPLVVDNHCRELNTPAAASPLGRKAYEAYRRCFGALLRRAVDCWVAVGPDERDFLSERLGIPSDQIFVIPLGFDPEVFFFDSARRQEMRADKDWHGDLVIVATGKLTAAKRLEVVAEACERSSPETRLVLAGSIERDYLRHVRAAAPALSQRNRLDVLPMLDRASLADLYRAADLAVFTRPSISVFEAIGTGLNVALKDDAYCQWIHGLHKQVYPFEYDSLELGSTSIDARPSAAHNAHANFSWNTVTARFLDLYVSIV